MKNKKLINSFKYAFSGIKTCIYKERNIKIHISIMFLVIISGMVLDINIYEWLVCLVLFGAVISAEMINTAIETVVDMITLKNDPLAKQAKDISAGAVLVLAIFSSLIGLIIFLPKIIKILEVL